MVTLRGLYGNSGVPARPASRAGNQSLCTGSVRAVASGLTGMSARSTRKPRLERPALSLSHLTWSLRTSTTAIRTCHQTTSFPVYAQISVKRGGRQSGESGVPAELLMAN